MRPSYEELKTKVQPLEELLKQILGKSAQLEKQLKHNSKNSSPPSTDQNRAIYVHNLPKNQRLPNFRKDRDRDPHHIHQQEESLTAQKKPQMTVQGPMIMREFW